MTKNTNNTDKRSIIGRAILEFLEGRQLLSTFTVTNTNDSGSGSLRQAMLNAEASAGADIIKFAIGSGLKTITPLSRLPNQSQPVTIDGTSQPGYAGKPLIEIRGDRAGTGGVNGFSLSGGNCLIKGLIINRFSGFGIFVNKGINSRIVGNFIGTDASGTVAAGNKGQGIYLQSGYNTVGGTSASDRNIISGNSIGVFFYGGDAHDNKVQGNYIGLDVTGTKAVGNLKCGVQATWARNNLVGGTAAGAGNVISGNGTNGILFYGTGSHHNIIQGNIVGLNKSGTAAIPNLNYGIEISQPNNTVGGAVAGARNIISGNAYSGVVLFWDTGNYNYVQGNYIGTDITGTKDIGNKWRGVEITNGAKYNTIGGTTALARNVITGNDRGGIGVYVTSTNNTIQGNYIGLWATGSGGCGNTGGGILTQSSNNTIGGTASGSGNFVGFNTGNGIEAGSGSGGAKILRNFVGIDAKGASAPNGGSGISIKESNNSNISFNVVHNNKANGIHVLSGTGVRVSCNSTSNNTGLGIHLGWGGHNNNDSGDADTGPNNLQNFPVLGKTAVSTTNTLVAATLQSKANTTYTIEFYSSPGVDTSGYGEARKYIGHVKVTTNSSGYVSFSAKLPTTGAGSYIAATATAPDGSTSELSKSVRLPTAYGSATTLSSGTLLVGSTAVPSTNPYSTVAIPECILKDSLSVLA